MAALQNNNVAHLNAVSCSHSDADVIAVTLSIAVHDGGMVWDAAVMKALTASNMRISDLIDVIGPREDPCLSECIAILTQPAAIPGCAIEEFDVEPALAAQVLAHSPVLIAA